MGDTERFQHAYRLYHELADADPASAEQRIAEIEAEDPALGAELRRLIALSASPGSSFLEPPATSSTDTEQDLRGLRLGEFELLEVLGRGGMGIVHRAIQHPLGREVAVKVMRGDVRLRDVQSLSRLQRFLREAQLPAGRPHPGLVPILAFGEANGKAYYAMELVEGMDLARLRRAAETRSLDLENPRVVASFIAHIAEALQHCHEHGIVHRDVKPQNILVDAEGRPRLVDFGVAMAVGAEPLTRTGEKPGTPLYMSPEQARDGRCEIDHRTDVYSLGAVFYELLTGQPPFVGDTEREVLHRISHDHLRPVRSLSPTTPEALQRICETALQKQPSDRYVSAARMAEDLRRFLRGESVNPPRPPVHRRVLRALHRRPRTMLVAAALLLGAVALQTWSHYRKITRSEVEFTVATGEVVELKVLRWTSIGELDLVEQFELRGARRRSLQPGCYRFEAETPDGATASANRILRHDTQAEVELHPTHWRALEDEMVHVPGGAITIEVPSKRPDGRMIRWESVRSAFAPFLMDPAPVTNREFQDHLLEIGTTRADLVAWRRWKGQPPIPLSEWERLPATNIPLEQALAYAEARGKTLPTPWEWAWAIQGGETCEWLELANHSPSTAPPSMLDEPMPDLIRDYFHAARPVIHPVGFGLLYDHGNVAELTMALVPAPGDHPWSSPTVITAGRAWIHSPEDLRHPSSISKMGHLPYYGGGGKLGFRCIKRISEDTEG